MSFEFKFGKAPARENAIKLRFEDLADIPHLRKMMPPLKHPTGPLGHIKIIREKDWGMLGNDKWGCCVFSGAAHETKLLAGLGGKQLWFSEKNVLQDYHDVTGFNWTADTDNGTDMQKAARYRQTTGIRDGHGNRHTVEYYVSIRAGDLEQHLMALWLFGGVAVGFEVPAYAPEQFNNNHIWDVQTVKTNIVGGHYVPVEYWDGAELQCVTWAANQGMTPGFLARYNDESIAYISNEMMTNRKSPEGFDYETLVARAQELQGPRSRLA